MREGIAAPLFLSLLLCLFLASAAQEEELFVSCDGAHETGNGSAEQPFVFLSSAVAAMEEGQDYIVRVAENATCEGASNTADMHIPSSASVTFLGDGGLNHQPVLSCNESDDIIFHFTEMRQFMWASIDIRGCGPLLLGQGSQTSESRVSLFSMRTSDTSGTLLQLTDVDKIEMEDCFLQSHSGAVVMAHSLSTDSHQYVTVTESELLGTGGFFLNGYQNVSVSDSHFENVEAPFSISAMAGQWQFDSCSFVHCSSAGYGGAINAVGLHWNTTQSLLSIQKSSFTSCSATRGGAVYANGGKVDIYSTFERNTASYGAAIALGAIEGYLILPHCSENQADELGGCLYLSEASSVTFAGFSDISDNLAGVAGSAFACSGPDNEIELPYWSSNEIQFVSFSGNKPEEYQNACVSDYYSAQGESTWMSSHWLLFATAVMGVVVIAVVLVAFALIETHKFIQKRRSEAAALREEQDGSDEEMGTISVEYDFSQPAAVVSDEEPE